MSGRKRVIVVDDSNLVRLRVANALSGHGVEVLEMRRAEDLLAAPEAVAQADLVILDLHLPGMDGLTALERLRRNGATARVPVMILSVSSDLGNVRRAVQLGAVDYLLKPFTDEALVERVTRIVGPLKRPGPSAAELRARLETEVRKEVKRARRANSALSLLRVLLPPELEWERLGELRERVTRILRETDACLPFPGGGLVLVLPLTPREGAEVVGKKVAQVLARAGAGQSAFRVAVFPEDGPDERALLAALEKEAEESAAGQGGSEKAGSQAPSDRRAEPPPGDTGNRAGQAT